jgi:high-affinity iron transporter
MSAFVISLREGLEAALIVSILLGTLKRLERHDLDRFVWLGAVGAIAVSMFVAVVLIASGVEFEGRAEQVFEATTLILAAAFLTGMMFWMQRQGAQLRFALEESARRAIGGGPPATRGVAAGSGFGLLAAAFLAVLREGIELALLLVATVFGASIGGTALGAALGIGAAVVLAASLYAGVVKLNLGRFFRVTNILLLLFAAGMVGLGIHELIEASLVPAVIDPVWNIAPILSDKSGGGQLLRSLFGYNSDPSLTEVLAYASYLAAAMWALSRQRPHRNAAASA